MPTPCPQTLSAFTDAVKETSRYANITDDNIKTFLGMYLMGGFLNKFDNVILPQTKEIVIPALAREHSVDFQIQSLSHAQNVDTGVIYNVNNYTSFRNYFSATLQSGFYPSGTINTVYWFATGLTFYPAPTVETKMFLYGQFSYCGYSTDIDETIFQLIPKQAMWACVYGVAADIAEHNLAGYEKIQALRRLEDHHAQLANKNSASNNSYGGGKVGFI